MLKIKDDVDLKELEKFGFRYDDRFERYLLMNKYYKSVIDIIVQKNRLLILGTLERLGTLFDLIQAGLVEKVEEAKWKIKDKECY